MLAKSDKSPTVCVFNLFTFPNPHPLGAGKKRARVGEFAAW